MTPQQTLYFNYKSMSYNNTYFAISTAQKSQPVLTYCFHQVPIFLKFYFRNPSSRCMRHLKVYANIS